MSQLNVNTTTGRREYFFKTLVFFNDEYPRNNILDSTFYPSTSKKNILFLMQHYISNYLANPNHPNTKYILDLHIKQRDRYRPYAPVILEEFTKKYFDIDSISPVMMSGGKVLSDKFPAITHIDGSARVQTLSKNDNENFYKLVSSFYKLSGFPIILNTSFNLPGEPIVESPFDALKSFSKGSLKYLCLCNYLVSRT